MAETFIRSYTHNGLSILFRILATIQLQHAQLLPFDYIHNDVLYFLHDDKEKTVGTSNMTITCNNSHVITSTHMALLHMPETLPTVVCLVHIVPGLSSGSLLLVR